MSRDAPELAADRRADRRALLAVAVLTCVSLIVTVVTRLAEAQRAGSDETAGEIWLLEATSHAVILGLAALFPVALHRFGAPLSRERVGLAAPALIAAFLAFTALHTGLMHLLRTALFPLLLGQRYVWRAFEPSTLAYEGMKDLFAFLLILFGFFLFRSIEAARLDQRERLVAARQEHRILLRSGGSTHAVPAADILWAEAAGNYAEVHTAGRALFVRMTFASLAQSLEAAGGRHARIHRSYIVNLDHVVSVKPTGEGDAVVHLSNGVELPASRRYRDALGALDRGPTSER